MPKKSTLVVSWHVCILFLSFGLGLLFVVLIRLWACVTRIGILNVSDGVVGHGEKLCFNRIYAFNFVYVNHIMDWGFCSWASPFLAMVANPMAQMCKT